MSIELKPLQKQHLEAFRWLVDGKMKSGRTTLLAYVYIENAYLHLMDWQVVNDHRAAKISDSHLLRRIGELLNADTDFEGAFEINYPAQKFRITRLD